MIGPNGLFNTAFLECARIVPLVDVDLDDVTLIRWYPEGIVVFSSVGIKVEGTSHP